MRVAAGTDRCVSRSCSGAVGEVREASERRCLVDAEGRPVCPARVCRGSPVRSATLKWKGVPEESSLRWRLRREVGKLTERKSGRQITSVSSVRDGKRAVISSAFQAILSSMCLGWRTVTVRIVWSAAQRKRLLTRERTCRRRRSGEYSKMSPSTSRGSRDQAGCGGEGDVDGGAAAAIAVAGLITQSC